MLIRHILPIAMAAATLMLSGVASNALPMANPAVAPAPIENVGWRCGPGWHMNRWGNCVPNHPVFVRPVRHWHPPFWFHHRWHPDYWGR
ncbi:GCG_CRPN prefix-to-repeats domain-containing protein [Mesorhizobium sp. IMUNJ 23033]|uniref:GCG_CRPN prefix-to-repeats domain-containing protein n=1 Tax=Mesorhizobium sp. IMUNJ 23033 TaxID=3378039 RepID=UPI00384ABA1D